MFIEELLKNGTNVSITISVKDLQEFVNYTITATRKELEQIIIEEKSEVYLSPKQVAEILDVSLTTLWRYSKSGYLKPLEVGGKRKYRKSEVVAKCLTNNIIN